MKEYEKELKDKMIEVVINRKYGGYGLSYKAVMAIAKRKGIKLYAYTYDYDDSSLQRVIPYNPKKHDVHTVHYCTKPNIKTNKQLNRFYYIDNWERTDKDLIAVVKKLGKASYGKYSALVIVKVPEDVEWEISDYDGVETIHEKHRVWY